MTEILGVETARPQQARLLRPRVLGRLLRDRVAARLDSIAGARVHFVDGAWRRACGAAAAGEPEVEVRVHDPRFWQALAFGGSVGAGESFAKGHWDCSDLSECLSIFVRNRAALVAMDRGLSRASAPFLKAFHKLRANTRRGSKRNIAAHYDLGNDFFALWLDPSMTYSSGVFARPGEAALDSSVGLEAAQAEKYERICKMLALRPGDEVCEIGTGWGGFALHVAQNYDCKVTTTTISARQAELARDRVRAAGLDARVELLQIDYRELGRAGGPFYQRFDALASIEMIEAVGHRYLPEYFRVCADLLKPDGRFALQAITISEQCYELAARSVDFIQRFIFPGCAIPSLASIGAALRERSDFRVETQTDYAPHYAHTLALWRRRFLAQSVRLEELGYDRFFRRLWEFYFAYCEAGFAERQLGLQHVLLARAARR